MILKVARRVYLPLWRAIQQWLDADGLRMSAAMSFYGILSLAPLLVLMVAVLGWWLDRAYIETSLVNQISRVQRSSSKRLPVPRHHLKVLPHR